ELRRLRAVGRRVVGDGLGPPNAIDSNHDRLEIRVLRLRSEVQPQQSDGEERREHDGDLQVCVQYKRSAVEFNELTLRVLDRLRRLRFRGDRGHRRSSYQRGWAVKWHKPRRGPDRAISRPTNAA